MKSCCLILTRNIKQLMSRPKFSKPDTSDPWRGLEFGYRFIEKFIQLPFRIPTPSPGDLENFLSMLNPTRVGTPNLRTRLKASLTKLVSVRRRSSPPPPDSPATSLHDTTIQAGYFERPPQSKQILSLISGENETDTIRRITLMV